MLSVGAAEAVELRAAVGVGICVDVGKVVGVGVGLDGGLGVGVNVVSESMLVWLLQWLYALLWGFG